MKHEINPQETTRAYAFEMWMKAPMPMVTFFKTLNVTRLVKLSKRTGMKFKAASKREQSDAPISSAEHEQSRMKFNMLMCYCIGKAASGIKEFYILPEGNKLMQFDNIAVNTIVANKEGEVSSCDIPFSEDLSVFNQSYLQLTKQVAETCTNHDLPESMVIGTSDLARYDIDGAVGMYSGIFNNPFLIWGKYKCGFFKTTLTVSFQFHHTQMDGAHAAHFLDELQKIIKAISL